MPIEKRLSFLEDCVLYGKCICRYKIELKDRHLMTLRDRQACKWILPVPTAKEVVQVYSRWFWNTIKLKSGISCVSCLSLTRWNFCKWAASEDYSFSNPAAWAQHFFFKFFFWNMVFNLLFLCIQLFLYIFSLPMTQFATLGAFTILPKVICELERE